MTDDRLTETELTQRLDDRDLLGVAHGPGVYVLRAAVPTDLPAVREQWDAVHDVRPGDDVLDRIARADRVAYVGASTDVYARLCDHAAGEVRQAAFLEAFDPVAVVQVWPFSNPFAQEFNTARRFSESGWRVWVDGGLL